MSRILRRPMFRGGGTVDSYGKGITAPLVPGYMGGGQIGGGIIYGKPMADGRFGFKEPILFNAAEMTMPTSGGITKGLELLARNKAINTGAVPFTSYNIPGVVDEKQGETEVNQEATAVEDIDIGDADNLFGELDTTETITLPDGSTKQVLVESDGPSPLVKRNLPFSNYTQEDYLRDTKYEDNKGKGRVFEGDEEMIGDPREYKTAQEIEEIGTGTGTGTGTGEGEETTQLSAKDAIAENQKLFAELLGSDKARGQDIGDMLLRFSGSGGNTLGEKFQNYVRAESAAGPSRSEKIKQTAAGLAINDYVAGKRAKEQGELLTKKIDYELDAKNKYLTPQADDSNSDILRKISTAYKIEPTSNKAIKALLKFRTGRSDIFAITKDPTKIKPKDLEIGINIVTHKGAKTIIEKISETETKVLPFSGI
jgi:hypothetical protein